ncbi:DNA gyrase subunit A [Pseudomonadota bacterium]
MSEDSGSNEKNIMIPGIKPVSISAEMKKSYLDYAMSVIVSRAIPDVCDGLKPVHRRILYVMHEGGYDYNKPFKKSARIVGEVMGKYHPHGDAAIYDALVRLAQDFSMGTMLIQGQGNFGSIDDDPPAAMRYTESRMQKISHTMVDDLDKDTVDFFPNYDGHEKEPYQLPAKFPNILANGSSGIAVGMATNIPPHNLGEIIDGTIAYINNPKITIDEILEYIPAPDFPTGALILGQSGYRQAAETGRGSVIMRGVVNIEEAKKGKEKVVITEIPYQVNKAKLVEKIAELVNEKKIEGVADLRDESSREGIRIVIELKRDGVPEVIINQLYSYTPLQSNFPMNMLALNHGKPETMGLLDIIRIFVKFRKNVVTRRTNFLLNKARERAHILIGLRVAVADIDEIIKLIKQSPDANTARKELMSRSWNAGMAEGFMKLVQDKGNIIKDGKFYFTELQARAILEMKLAKLTGLESGKIENELNELAAEITEYLSILADSTKLMNIIKDELIDIKEKFAVPRRSKIEAYDGDVDMEDLIAKEDMVVVFTMGGYVKRMPLSTYKAQKRGGKGKSGMTIKEEDAITNLFIANTHMPILFFTNVGQVYKMKTYKLPQGTAQSKGRALVNLFPFSENEKVSRILALPEDEETWKDWNIVFATKKGSVRRNTMAEFTTVQSNGKIAIKLDEDNELIGVALCNEQDDVLLATKLGKCIRFPVESLRVFKGRNSSGVRGIKLDAFNEVISMSILKNAKVDTETRDMYLKIPVEQRIQLKEMLVEQEKLTEGDLLGEIEKPLPIQIDSELSQDIIGKLARDEELILTIAENGFGKRSSAYEYRITNRGGTGITNIVTSKRNGSVVASFVVDNDDDIIMIGDKGTMIRTDIASVRISGRNTQGVTLMRAKDEKVVSVARVVKEEEEDEDGDTVEG